MAQEIYNKQTAEVQKELHEFTIDLLNKLYSNEIPYTHELYDELNLAHDVKKFLRYNANKALNNLGFEAHFEAEDVNPVVLNGLSTSSKSHDFFSMKGNSYKMAVVEPIQNEDFYFSKK